MAFTETIEWGRLVIFPTEQVTMKYKIVINKDGSPYIKQSVADNYAPGSDISNLPGKIQAGITAVWSYEPP